MSDDLVKNELRYAPGWPGIEPRWTSSAKTGVGTSLNLNSRVWFTLSHGILNEVYFPRVDQACTRDFGLIVTDGREFFSEEKRHCESHDDPLLVLRGGRLRLLNAGIPSWIGTGCGIAGHESRD